MDSLVRSLGDLVTAENTTKLAKFLHTDAASVGKAAKVLIALSVASMVRKAATPTGAAAMESLPQEEAPGMLKSVFSALWGQAPDETPADQRKTIFGSGVNSMLTALTQRLGFNLAPLADSLTPRIGELLLRASRDQGLDASGFFTMLQQGQQEFQKDPANAETIAIVRETLAIGDQALTLREQFTEAELEAIHLAPQAAYWLVAQASLSGIRGTIREMKAASQVGIDLMKTVPPVSLMALAFGGGSGLSAAEEEELLEDTRSEDDLLDNIRAASAVIAAKAPDELEIFRTLIREVAQKTAEAAKEGGFLGIGGVLVSEKERAAIAKVEAALAP
ncbi:hypothetical protein [Luteolibacter luteus]|uniref:DUF937 domain-containing protein n=1 Tax=Luteolibacter luteus TaxID=2728835 RepID=A0A858RHP8_9BACT|nr:hypothetical protein [Luteolibacter luteus]QJE96074.1 hypothetical protein HHL09_09845 [Luteolibacter luteus]